MNNSSCFKHVYLQHTRYIASVVVLAPPQGVPDKFPITGTMLLKHNFADFLTVTANGRDKLMDRGALGFWTEACVDESDIAYLGDPHGCFAFIESEDNEDEVSTYD